MKLQYRSKKSVFKVSDDLDKSFKLLYGHEPEEGYSSRLKASAQRVVFGKPGPIACYDCGLEDQDVLEIHHILDDSDMSGNDWRKVHGQGAEFHRYILNPEVTKPELVLLCPTCHTRRHKRGHNDE
jgi:hypothetical protein